MDVEIVDFTGKGSFQEGSYAARLLAFTKNTRLKMSPGGFQKWLDAPWELVAKEIEYMANTIPSSWEFVDVTFSLQDVTRACAQQITRTRYTPMDVDIYGSYAMQSQRVTDMSEVTYAPIAGEQGSPQKVEYNDIMYDGIKGYCDLVAMGVPLEDARGVLPMNAHCNLVVQYNLRALAELFRKRDSLRVQGEFGSIVKEMRAQVERIWPWSQAFFIPKEHAAIKIIEDVARTLPEEQRRALAKAADLLKL